MQLLTRMESTEKQEDDKMYYWLKKYLIGQDPNPSPPGKEKYLAWTLLPFFGSWVFYIILISIASIGTAVARKTVDPNIELIPEMLLKYALEFTQLYIWVPVAWLLGETGIRLVELFVSLRTGQVIPSSIQSNPKQNNSDPEIEQTEDSFEEMNKQFSDSKSTQTRG